MLPEQHKTRNTCTEHHRESDQTVVHGYSPTIPEKHIHAHAHTPLYQARASITAKSLKAPAAKSFDTFCVLRWPLLLWKIMCALCKFIISLIFVMHVTAVHWTAWTPGFYATENNPELKHAAWHNCNHLCSHILTNGTKMIHSIKENFSPAP